VFQLRLNDVAMVAADTSRTRAYLQALVRNDLFPNYVLLLEHDSDSLLPGQLGNSKLLSLEVSDDADDCWSEAHFNPTQPIKPLLGQHGISYGVSPSKDINDPSVASLIRQRPETVFIYSGFGGVLLRKDVLATGKRFLHVHGGYLPAFKGSTTNYFSLLAENTMGASSIFLSDEIDSGPVLVRRKFPPPVDRQGIDHVYDSAARAKVLVQTLQHYLKCGDWEFELPSNDGGETYYIIHPVLKHIAILDKGLQDKCV